MNILITSAGQRVSLVRAFQRELYNIYPGQEVFTTDLCPQLSPACQVSDKYFQVRKVTDPAYVEELIQLCRRYHIKMVVPTIDTELLVLAQHREMFRKENIHVIISSPAFIETCRDKRKTNSFFQERGLMVPAAIDKYNPVFPLFIKPYNGSLSVDTYIIRAKEELQAHHLNNDRFLFMEYLDKQDYDEYTVDLYYNRTGHVKCIVPRKRIMVRAGEVSKGITCKNGLVDTLREKLSYIPGAAGCLTAQFFLHKTSEQLIAIEINGRFGGGYPLSYRAGANYPQWLIEEYFNGKEIVYTEDWEDQLLMLRYDAEVLVHGNKD
jgi:carbamoyl-phosphate synthase large subunit